MKKYICFRIKYAYLYDIESIDVPVVQTQTAETTVTFLNGKGWNEVKTRFNAELIEEYKPENNIGDTVVQTLSFTAYSQVLDLLKISRIPLVWELKISDGRTIVWGDKNNPVLIKKLTNEFGDTQMQFERTGLKPELQPPVY